MLLTVAMSLLLQGPQEDMKDWVDRGYDRGQPHATVVSGTPELSRDEAWAAVNALALEQHRTRLAALAKERAAARSKPWTPEFVTDAAVAQWTADQMKRLRLKVLDRDMLVRDHGFGESFQGFLLLDSVDLERATGTRSLTRRLHREEKRFAIKCGGAVGWWGVLALMVLWLDRMTRGYMTGRLYSLGAVLGVSVPILLVLL